MSRNVSHVNTYQLKRVTIFEFLSRAIVRDDIHVLENYHEPRILFRITLCALTNGEDIFELRNDLFGKDTACIRDFLQNREYILQNEREELAILEFIEQGSQKLPLQDSNRKFWQNALQSPHEL
jgi:hypothetical protein